MRVVALATLVLCAVPPATNFGPGMGGYVLTVLVLVLLGVWLHDRHDQGMSLSRVELGAGAALFGWVLLSVVRSGPLWDTALAAVALAMFAAACPGILSRRVTREDLRSAVVLMCGAAIIGSAAAAWLVPLLMGEGWVRRPGLPIGGASNNAVGLSLALAGALVGARRWPAQRVIWWLLALVSALLIVQSMSRAGWILGLVVLVAAIQLRWRWRARRVLVLGGAVAVLGVGQLMRMRGQSFFIDSARTDNAAVGLEAWASSPLSAVFGHGSMQVWPWLASERAWARADVSGSMQHETPWGTVLYHAHSTYLGVLVEQGLVGLLALLVVLALVARRCVVEIRGGGDLALVAVAVLLALPAMVVELYIFRGFVSAFLWWAAAIAVGVRAPAR